MSNIKLSIGSAALTSSAGFGGLLRLLVLLLLMEDDDEEADEALILLPAIEAKVSNELCRVRQECKTEKDATFETLAVPLWAVFVCIRDH